jgi:hypothetical protein
MKREREVKDLSIDSWQILFFTSSLTLLSDISNFVMGVGELSGRKGIIKFTSPIALGFS